MCFRKKNCLNTYYLKQFRNEAKNEWRVIWEGYDAYYLQHFRSNGTEYVWQTIETFWDRNQAFDYVDSLRRDVILSLVKKERLTQKYGKEKIY